MKNTIKFLFLMVANFAIAQVTSIQNSAQYRDSYYDGTYIHGVDNLGNPALSGDSSFRELPSGINEGVYSWWNYQTSVGEPSDSYGAAIGFGNGQAGTAEIWAGWTNGKLFTRYLRDCCQGWSSWNEIWTSNTDGAGSGLDADTVDGMQPLLIQNSGNVGIGTTDTKGFKLGVQGKIAAEEVKVAMYTNWADFVFESNYNLPSLKEVEQHIKEKGHLKDIPSAEDVKENGIFLGEMDSKLLQKIEELTLYAIEQEKSIENLISCNNEQQKEIETLKEENNELKSLSKRLTEIEKLLVTKKH